MPTLPPRAHDKLRRSISCTIEISSLGRPKSAIKSYFVFLRLYGPLEPWFDKTSKPGDFEKLD